MSGNSWTSALHTAPIVTAFWRGRCSSGSGGSGISSSGAGVSVLISG